jgi:hypothetical protein
MNDFTASNGIGVEINDEEQIVFAVGNRPITPIWTDSSELKALREFFRAEEDERLGRWRDARYPDFAVYPQPVDPSRGAVRGVTILSERIPRIYTAWEDNLRTFYGDSEDEETRRTARDVAAAYFDAHPEPKPLPTIPGLYVGGALDGIPTVWSLDGDGSWRLINTNSLFPIEDGHIHKYLPFSRLLPEVSS